MDFKARLALGNPRPSTGQVPSARGREPSSAAPELRDGGREQHVLSRPLQKRRTVGENGLIRPKTGSADQK